MLAIVLENDQHSRKAITNMLFHLGYTRVLHADHVDEAVYFFTKEKNRVNLVVTSAQANYGEDLPISRFLLKTPEMNLCPLLVSTDQWVQNTSSPFQNRFSRVDGVVSKPFFESHFSRAVVRAQERRAKLRNTLLVFGPDTAPDLEEAVFSSSKESHWKSVIRLQTKEELAALLKNTEFRAGALIVPATLVDEELTKSIRHFKRTVMGAATPLAIVADFTAEMPRDLRLLGDVFFEKNVKSTRLAVKLSKRLVHQWEVQKVLKTIGEATPRQVKALLQKNSTLWEVQTAAGAFFKKIGLLKKALETNPYSPAAHINLYRLSPKSEKPAVALKAKFFCPKHPEVLALES